MATATKEDAEPVLRLTKLMGLIGGNFFGSSLDVFILAYQQRARGILRKSKLCHFR